MFPKQLTIRMKLPNNKKKSIVKIGKRKLLSCQMPTLADKLYGIAMPELVHSQEEGAQTKNGDTRKFFDPNTGKFVEALPEEEIKPAEMSAAEL